MSSSDTKRTPPGFLNVAKPAGMTSYDVIRELKEVLPDGVHIGHGGTLDKAAEGVLPIGLGRATKLFEYFPFLAKTYQGKVLFGLSTQTHDLNGGMEALDTSVELPDQDEIREKLADFTGIVEQIPPAWSAIKRNGKALYEKAEAGEDVEPDPRPVEIHHIDLTGTSSITAADLISELAEREEGPELPDGTEGEFPILELEVQCGGGTYLRSLARDLGVELDSRGTLYHLIRTTVGPFLLERSWQLDEVCEELEESSLEDVLDPMVWGVSPERVIELEDQEFASLVQGNLLTVDARRVGFKTRRYYPEDLLEAWDEMPESIDPREKRSHQPLFCVDSRGRLRQVAELVGQPISERLNLKIRKNLIPQD